MEMVYFNKTRKIGNVTLNYNTLNESFVRQIEGIVIDIAKQMKVDLKKPNGNDSIAVYVHPSRAYFRKLFGEVLEQRERHGAKAQMNIVTTDDGQIHILVEDQSGSKALAMLLVSEIFGELIDDKKLGKVGLITKEMLEKKDKKEIEEEEEIEEEILDEEIEEPELTEKERTEDEETEEIPEEEEIKKIEKVIEEKEVELPAWLVDGWYKYKRGYMTEERSKDLGEYLQSHKVAKVETLQDGVSMTKEYNRGYELKCTRVEYIIATYGMKKLRKFFENPDIRQTFKITKRQFDNDWKEYLKTKYVKKAMEDVKISKTKDKEPQAKSEKTKIRE